jgi:small subunit ribosomal protein S20
VSRIRTFIKKVETAIAAGKKSDAQQALKEAQPELMRGVSKGVVKMGTASRKMSRLSARIKNLAA